LSGGNEIGINTENMKIVHIGIGLIPVPPGNIAASREEHLYHLTNYLGRFGCRVHFIDIKGGALQQKERQKSSAKFHEAWYLPLVHSYNYPRQGIISYYLYFLRDALAYIYFTLSSGFVLYKLMGKEKIDVIHAHNTAIAFAAIIVNKLRRKTAVTVYTPYSPYWAEKWSLRHSLIRFPLTFAVKWVDHIVALTHSIKDGLVSQRKLEPGKIAVISAGIPLDEIEECLSHKEEVRPQSKIVFCAGIISQRKNQFTAVKAISQVIKTHPEVKFVLTGSLGEAKYLELMQKFVTENNLSQYIEFRGEVSKQEIYSLYRDATLFLFPTTSDTQPRVLKEAAAFRLPIISSTIESIDGMLGGKGCAILVAPYDTDGMATAILRVLEDDSLRQSMSRKAQELAQGFSYEHVAAQTMALYEELVQNKKQSQKKKVVR
jgi:glycosyltransferase involved in cell wall biosynthesis